MKILLSIAAVSIFSCSCLVNIAQAAEGEGDKKGKADRKKSILEALGDEKSDKKTDKAKPEKPAKDAAKDEVDDQLADLFAKLDKNSDGKLNKPEFGQLPKELGPIGRFIKRSLPKMYSNFDKNRNGTLSKSEFIKGADKMRKRFGMKGNDGAKKQGPTQAEKNAILAKTTLKRLDKNKDGFISKKEGKRDRKLKKVFAKIDADLDEKLTEDEITTFLNDSSKK